MVYYLFKIATTVGLIVAVSEISKRNTTLGALLASLPLISLLSFVWIYVETNDVERVSQLSRDIFWLVLPSLPLFLVLPWLLRQNINFYASLAVSSVVTFVSYSIVMLLLQRLNPSG